MKVQVRRGVFETNSSSTHSLTMCSKDDYTRWESGELVLNESYGLGLKGDFVTKEDAVKALISDGSLDEIERDEEKIEDVLYDNELYTYSRYESRYDDYEWFEDNYKTKTGEEVVAFGHYGWDG